MKTRESGMPEEAAWNGFFDPPGVLARLGLTPACGDLVEFGCGYGTFTIPAAKVITGTVFALDIDEQMIETTRAKARTAALNNVQLLLRDFVTEGTGLPDDSVDYVMLFNILHAEHPEVLLREAHRVLAPGGRLGIMHWVYDPSTPRGPSMEIRPRPEQCRTWAEEVGFRHVGPSPIDLPPYHYGLVMEPAVHSDPDYPHS